MTNQELQEKLESLLEQVQELNDVACPSYVAQKLVNANNELELAIKFLKLK